MEKVGGEAKRTSENLRERATKKEPYRQKNRFRDPQTQTDSKSVSRV